MDAEFINAYIERLATEVTESLKTRLIVETQLAIASKTVASLTAENEKLQASLNKKSSKIKEDNTF
jgi:hypothetical protein